MTTLFQIVEAYFRKTTIFKNCSKKIKVLKKFYYLKF